EIVKLLSANTQWGQCYRVDLRLRPHGGQSELCLSLPKTLAYYDQNGRTWERQALVKVRPIAGDYRLGNEFTKAIEPFVYRHYLNYFEINEIKSIKRSIESKTREADADASDLKTGHGGIRDIEFVTQFLQLVNGRSLPEIRERNTLAALRKLTAAGCINRSEHAALESAYRFGRIAAPDAANRKSRMKQLLELAKERFPHDWTDADERLFGQTAIGEVADYGDGDPAEADKWGEERVLRADRIEWLCTDREAITAVTHRGVQIKGARIDGELDLSFAKIEFPLAIEHSAIPRGMVMQRCHLYALFLAGTHTGPINADGLRVEHDLHMRDGFHAAGEVRLLNATISGTLDCGNSHFSNPDGVALNADAIDVKGSVFLRNEFKAEGEVRLLSSTIGHDLDCENGNFSNPDGNALIADGIDVKGTVLLRNEFKAEGAVRLLGAMIGSDLECDNSRFSKPNGVALQADKIKVSGSVFLREQFRAEGDVVFDGATVGRSFQWWGVKDSDRCRLRLSSAKIGTLWDEEESWPATLFLDGLVYDRLYSDAPTDSDSRLRWLKRQGYGKGKFVPQPYVQLAKVLQEMGHEADARRILIAKQKDPARVAALTIPARIWHHLLGLTIGYGYRPSRALWWIVGFIALGAVLFQIGADNNVFQKTIEGEPPAFNTFVYSLDSFVPLID
ncbi:MAG: hypothetical protein IH897_16790, partial [Planctomycetes bacterium]|nr:hypothetical protein [Planctomycetota bacterium]